MLMFKNEPELQLIVERSSHQADSSDTLFTAAVCCFVSTLLGPKCQWLFRAEMR